MISELKQERNIGKGISSLLIIILLILNPICHAQTPFVFSGPRLELRNHMLHISYDILNSDLNDKFTVSITITEENGNHLNAIALSGDLGEIVSGGFNKRIIWDPEADSFLLNTSLYVKIDVISNRSSEPVMTAEEYAQEQARTEQRIPDEEPREDYMSLKEPENTVITPAMEKTFTRTGIVIQSLVIPGLGLSRVTGNPHWLKGVAGYGCIAGSVYLNREAINTYSRIDDMEDYEDKNDLYEQAMRQDNISEVLAYAAIGIWVTDFIWTLLATSGLKEKSIRSDVSGFSLKTNIDTLTYAPMLGICYKF